MGRVLLRAADARGAERRRSDFGAVGDTPRIFAQAAGFDLLYGGA
jgi:hypothetical protein